jgi:hypothetical protein
LERSNDHAGCGRDSKFNPLVLGEIQAADDRAFGVTSISVKRSVKLYREKGTRGFYAPRVTRGAAVLVDSVVAQIEEYAGPVN